MSEQDYFPNCLNTVHSIVYHIDPKKNIIVYDYIYIILIFTDVIVWHK